SGRPKETETASPAASAGNSITVSGPSASSCGAACAAHPPSQSAPAHSRASRRLHLKRFPFFIAVPSFLPVFVPVLLYQRGRRFSTSILPFPAVFRAGAAPDTQKPPRFTPQGFRL